MKKIYEGLQILLKYEPEGGMSAEHDEVFADGPSPANMSAEDVEKLEELGWRFQPEFDSWRAFV